MDIRKSLWLVPAALLVSQLALRAQISGEDWTRIAVLGANVTSIAVSPTYETDGTVFAATRGMGVFRSTDSGATWAPSEDTDIATSTITDLAISPNFPSDKTLFAITEDGRVLRSINAGSGGGFTFSQRFQRSVKGTSLAIHPAYDRLSGNRYLFAGFETEGVWFTTDENTGSWYQDGDRITSIHVYDLAISPAFAADNYLFVGGHYFGTGTSTGPVWRRTGLSGASWMNTSSGLGTGAAETVLSLRIHPAFNSTGTLWAGTELRGMWLNTDAGNKDNPWAAGCDGALGVTLPSVNALAFSGGFSPVLLEGREDSLFQSADQGVTCAPLAPFSQIRALAFQPNWNGTNTCHVFIGTPHGLFRKTCAIPLGNGPQAVDAVSVALAGASRGAFIGSKSGGLFKSKEPSDLKMVKFNNFPNKKVPEVVAVRLGPSYGEGGACGSDQAVVFVAANFPGSPSDNGVYRSLDFGNNWNKLASGSWPTTPLIVHDLAVSPAYGLGVSGGQVYAATSIGLFRMDYTPGVGEVWTANLMPSVVQVYAVGLPPSFDWNAGCSGGNPCKTVFVCDTNDAEFRVWYSTAGGSVTSWVKTGYQNTWGRVTSFAFPFNFGISGYSTSVYASAVQDSALTGGVYLSSGPSPWSTWTSRSTGLGDPFIWDIAAEPNFLKTGSNLLMLCAAKSGIYQTRDAGLTWSQTNNIRAYSVCFDPDDALGKAVMAGYQAAGAAISEDGGASFPFSFSGYGSLPDDVYSTIAHMRDPNILFAASPTMGAFVSEDKGVSFRPWNLGAGGTDPCVLSSGYGLGMMTDRCGEGIDSVYAGTFNGGIKYRRTTFNATSGTINLDAYSWKNTSGSATTGRFERFDTLGTATETKIWASSSGRGVHYLPKSYCYTWSDAAIPSATATYIKYGYASTDGSPLTDGAPVAGSVGQAEWDYYFLDVPSGSLTLNCFMDELAGDPDMYIRYGSLPTDTLWDYRPYISGDETVCVDPHYYQPFEAAFPPTGWTVTDSAGTGNIWRRNDQFPTNPGNRTTSVGGTGFSAAAEAFLDGNTNAWDSTLRSPAIDLTSATAATLTYSSNFQDYVGNGEIWLDISTNGGSSWTNLRNQTTDDPAGGTFETEDLTPYVGFSVLLRWRYQAAAGTAWYWHIDNVKITRDNPQSLIPGTWYIGLRGYAPGTSSYQLTATVDGCSPSLAPMPPPAMRPIPAQAENLPNPEAPSAATTWGTVNGSGVYKGSDSAPALPGPSAVTWTQRNGTTQPLTNLFAQCVVQLNDLTVVAGCDGGVFYSPAPDEGQTTWTESTSGVAGTCSYDFRDFYYMYPTSGGNGDLLIAANGAANGGVWLSGDKGRHWMKISNGFDASSRAIEDIVADGGNPPSYYSSTDATGVYTRTISASSYPLVTGLSANTGPVTGGTSITVTGVGFSNSCPTGTSSDCPDASPVVLFGETEAAATYVSPTQLTVTSPAHTTGVVAVSVRNRDTRLSPGGPAFSYTCAAPVVGSNNSAADASLCADTGVTVAWSSNPSAWSDGGFGTRSYSVLRNGGVIQSGLSYGTTSWTDTGGVNGTSYIYSVRYYNGCGLYVTTAGFSAADNVGANPSSFANNTAADLSACADTGVQVAWSAPGNWGDNGSGTRTYDVLRNGSAIATGLPSGTVSYTDSTGTNGVSYTYTVRAVNGCALSSTTSGASASDQVGAAPSLFANNSAVDLSGCNDTGVRVTWSAPGNWGDNGSGTRNFDVLRNGSAIATGLSSATTSYTDTTGTNGTSYTYAVRANNGCGLSTTTAGVSAADLVASAPSAWANNTAADLDPYAETGVGITWTDPNWGDNGSGTRTFDVLRDGVPIVTGLAASNHDYTDTEATVGVTYVYSVRANNGCGFSATTAGTAAADQFLVPAEAASTPAAALKWVGSSKNQLNWGATTGATAYRVYKGDRTALANLPPPAPDASVCTAYDGAATSTSANLNSNPAPGEFFWWLVAAYNGAGEGTLGTGSGGSGRAVSTSGACASP